MAFKQSVSFSVLLVIPGIISLMICGFAVGLLLTPIGMLYTDIQRGLTIALPFFMYLAPVIYPMPKSGSMAVMMKLNPVATLLVETRNWFTSQPTEDLELFLIYTGFFAAITFLGIMIFRVSMPMIIERIGS